jgi:cation diffusion facilitator CzcD-associated flavoprotein CzcO
MADFLVPNVTGPGNLDASKRLAGPLHAERHVRVICIGAGASGLLMAYKLQKHFQNFSLQVYEKNPEVAGTWYENKYPG